MKNSLTLLHKVKQFLGYKYLVVSKGVIIEYGFHFAEMGITYHMLKWSGSKWIKTAWTYHSIHISYGEMVKYLLRSGRSKLYRDEDRTSFFGQK